MLQSLDALGFEPALSEYNTFPIQPEAATVENCIAVVERKADIFVLIIGGRYGSVTGDGKSITNREYLAARAKGIPIYVFVQRSILDLLGTWKDNPGMDFSSAVDSPRLFEFVSELRDGGERWVLSFDTAQEIFAALRTQLAYLFRDALQLRLRATNAGALSERYRHLSAKELRLLIERSNGWEYLLLAAAIRREFGSLDDFQRDWRYGIAFGPARAFKPSDFIRWSQEKNDEVKRIIGNIGSLLNDALKSALGPSGVSGDPDAILYVVSRFASLYRSVLQWKLDFICVSVPPEFERIKVLGSCFCDSIVAEINDFKASVPSRIEEAVREASKGERVTVNLSLTLTLGDLEPFETEAERLRLLIETGQLAWN
jgi:hypothetical protein